MSGELMAIDIFEDGFSPGRRVVSPQHSDFTGRRFVEERLDQCNSDIEYFRGYQTRIRGKKKPSDGNCGYELSYSNR